MKKIFFSIILILFFISCHHDKDEVPQPAPPIPACWEKFVADYIVYDTANNITYNMKIEHKDSVQVGYANIDSLIITNYGNMFNLRLGFLCQSDANLLYFSTGVFPNYDHNNKRWAFSINSDDTTTTKYENQLKNDTIILYFKMDNIAFYYYDSVPYYSANIKHIAVKQH